MVLLQHVPHLQLALMHSLRRRNQACHRAALLSRPVFESGDETIGTYLNWSICLLDTQVAPPRNSA